MYFIMYSNHILTYRNHILYKFDLYCATELHALY